MGNSVRFFFQTSPDTLEEEFIDIHRHLLSTLQPGLHTSSIRFHPLPLGTLASKARSHGSDLPTSSVWDHAVSAVRLRVPPTRPGRTAS